VSVILHDDRYQGKVAVVTGGASGIGEAIVRRVILEGGSVVAADLNQTGLSLLAAELGERFVPLTADVTKESDMKAMVATAVQHFGALHAAFNVAGGGRPAKSLDELTEEDWDFTVDLCLKGAFLAMKHEARRFLEQGQGGAIVIISSLNSEVPMVGGAPYCSAKAGSAMLAKCGALEWGSSGIRVSAVSPGLTDTPLTSFLSQMPSLRAKFMEHIPLNRAATPDDVAAAACFLASDEASYISGVNLFVDGAWSTTAYPDLRSEVAAGLSTTSAGS
jgi:NAD(P)-dependent dehydrogenase (short-subunit alcohol dehydrogenase family)